MKTFRMGARVFYRRESRGACLWRSFLLLAVVSLDSYFPGNPFGGSRNSLLRWSRSTRMDGAWRSCVKTRARLL
jgi:hypothetical protein